MPPDEPPWAKVDPPRCCPDLLRPILEGTALVPAPGSVALGFACFLGRRLVFDAHHGAGDGIHPDLVDSRLTELGFLAHGTA